MAHIQLNKKGFRVIVATAEEFLAAGFGASDNIHEDVISDGIFAGFTQLTIEGGGWLVCDSCNEEITDAEKCYYVAVLGRIFCKKCFEEWIADATYYESDRPYEERNFDYAKAMLEEAGHTI